MDFDQKDEAMSLGAPVEGLLCKYTNMVKGWQYRWFVIDSVNGYLEYHEKEEFKNQKPRGTLPLAGAVVVPSDEDSVTFLVHATTGEIYRLRAHDAKSRQFWVTRLRYAAEEHGKLATSMQLTAKDDAKLTGDGDRSRTVTVATDHSGESSEWIHPHPNGAVSLISLEDDPLQIVRNLIHNIYGHEEKLSEMIESLPASSQINPLDRDLLLLKASSKSAVSCIEQCLHILEAHQASGFRHREHSVMSRRWRPNLQDALPIHSSLPALEAESAVSLTTAVHTQFDSQPGQPADAFADFSDEVEDSEQCAEHDLGAIEEHKSVILQVLSQLKFGMDLTKVVLPTFILEKKSLLEMFSDCMCHGQLFTSISSHVTAEERMLHVLEWYLTSFHGTQLGSVAKKPYNPVIGETFSCSWLVPCNEHATDYRMRYCSEQVSHHPPVSAFYVECPDASICLNASIWTRSKYMGMSIGVNMIGSMTLSLANLDEDYVMTLPSAYARSILSCPWVELGDRVCISCKKTGYSAAVVFHTKPFYGGKLHRITGEVKNSEGVIVCKVAGEWNGVMELTNSNGMILKTVDCDKLPTINKRVLPLSLQKDHESRKLWASVTSALRDGNMEQATLFKSQLEDRQREKEKHRINSGLPYYAKFFRMQGDAWLFKNIVADTS